MNLNQHLVIGILAILLAACGGGGGGGGADDVTGDGAGQDIDLAKFCEEHPGEACDDDNPCTLGEGICSMGQCLFDEEYTCDQTDAPGPCLGNGQCDGEGGCTWSLVAGWCQIDGQCIPEGQAAADNDCLQCVPDENRTAWTPVSAQACTPQDNPCSTTGYCQEGFCVPDATGVDCASDLDCAYADDGDLCNGRFTCQDCQCVYDPSTAVVCDDSEDTACAKTSCVPESGACVQNIVMDGTPCEDGDPCTGGDECLAGECKPGAVGGQIWKPVGAPQGAWLNTLIAMPNNPSTLLAVGKGGGVFRSIDGGKNWFLTYILGYGEEEGDWLLAGKGEAAVLLVVYGDKLFRSMDGGNQWTQVQTGCQAVTQMVSQPGSFVAACNNKTLVSNDAGATWSQSGGGLPGGGNRVVTGLQAVDTSTWYLGTRDEDGDGRGWLYRSTDGGSSWQQASLPGKPDKSAVSRRGVLVHPSNAQVVFAGLTRTNGKTFDPGQSFLYRSNDGGNNWMALNPGVLAMTSVPLGLDSIGRLLASNDAGLNRGGNMGDGPWGHIPEPPAGFAGALHTITSAMIDPMNEFSFYVPAANGLAIAKDLGQTWEIHNAGMVAGRHAVLLITSDEGGMLTQEVDSGQVLRSTDGGETWTAADLGQSLVPPMVTAFGEGADGKLLAATLDGGFARSQDDGQTWAWKDPTLSPIFTRIAAAAAPPSGWWDANNWVFAWMEGVGLWRSNSGGMPSGDSDWQLLSMNAQSAASIMYDQENPGYLYLGTRTEDDGKCRIYRSTNNGDSWDPRIAETGTAFKVFPDLSNSMRAFAAKLGVNGAIYRTTSSGSSWDKLSKQPTFANIRRDDSLLPDPDNTGVLYAPLWLSGVWKFDPEALTWALVEGSNPRLVNLAWHPDQANTMLGADGSAPILWASDDGGATWEESHDFGGDFARVRKVISRPHFTAAILEGDSPGDGALFLWKGGQWVNVSDDLPGGAWDVEERVLGQDIQLLASGELFGLFRSDDMGDSWETVPNFPNTGALDIEVAPDDPNNILATTTCGSLPETIVPGGYNYDSDCGLYRSQDGGESWNPSLSMARSCTAITFRPSNGQEAYAACPGAGLYRTQNGGSSWSNISSGEGSLSGLPLEFTDVAAWGSWLALGSSVTGVHMGKGPDNDPVLTSWYSQQEASPRPDLLDARVMVDPVDSARIIISALPGGLYMTTDNGNSWRDLNGTLGPDWDEFDGRLPMNAQVVHFGGQTRLWAAVDGKGLYESDIQFPVWLKKSAGLQPVDTVHPFELHEAKTNWTDTTQMVWLVASEGVFRSTDGGGSWQQISVGLPTGKIQDFVPPAGQYMYLSVGGSQLYWASPDGANWSAAEAINPHGQSSSLWGNRTVGFWSWLLPDPDLGARMLASVDPGGLWLSTDGGTTWKPTGFGLPAGGTYALVTDPDDDSLLAGTIDGLYVSLDGGESFEPSGDEWDPAWGAPVAIFPDPLVNGRILVISEPGPKHGMPPSGGTDAAPPKRLLLVTENDGASWLQVSQGIDAKSGLLQVIGDPLVQDAFYLATAKMGVFRSMDGGQTWESWNTGLPGPRLGSFGLLRGSCMGLSTAGDRLYLGTAGFGLYTRFLDSACEQD